MTMPPETYEKLDEPVDRLLAEALSAELEPQRGKAATAFRASMKVKTEPVASARDENVPAPLPLRIQERDNHGTKDISRREFWLWTSVPSLMAACLAVAVTLAFLPGRGAVNARGGEVGMIVAKSNEVEQVTVNRGETSGVMVSNNTPVRMVRQQTVNTTRWVEPGEKATYMVTEPVERVGYVEIKPF